MHCNLENTYKTAKGIMIEKTFVLNSSVLHLTTESFFYHEGKLFFILFSTAINDRRIEVINCVRDNKKKRKKKIDLTILSKRR
jgi:hypothetical protein